jgi:predicted hotdog family 3-hydroxylacyl-ACP dehydratase
MVLLDEVKSASPVHMVCTTKIRERGPFVREGRVAAVTAVELMAQAAAALFGFISHQRGEPIRLGWLLGARELTLAIEAFAVGDALEIHAIHVWGDERFATLECEVRRDGHTVATGRLNVLRTI